MSRPSFTISESVERDHQAEGFADVRKEGGAHKGRAARIWGLVTLVEQVWCKHVK